MWLQILFTISLFGLSNCCSCAPPNITNTYCLADAGTQFKNIFFLFLFRNVFFGFLVAHVVVHNATVNLSVGNEYGVEYIKIYRVKRVTKTVSNA